MRLLNDMTARLERGEAESGGVPEIGLPASAVHCPCWKKTTSYEIRFRRNRTIDRPHNSSASTAGGDPIGFSCQDSSEIRPESFVSGGRDVTDRGAS